ncbi:VIT1/CCC1 transporter family protein [Candidatus Woesearchaeota archaeon]|nr:VIT1/CCC1 transporter family protein [Candidatus Woesearchaeota archaeon]
MEKKSKKHSFLEKTKDLVRDFIFGMQDGLISNLGLVLGVWQGGGDRFVIVLAGLASMFAGAFSMSAGSYLSAKSQREVYEHEIRHTKEELKKNPQKGLVEMRQILKEEEFDDDEIEALLHHFEHHNQTTFMRNYIQKKLGLSEQRFELPLKNAIAMFFSFLTGSIIPIAPFFFFIPSTAALVSSILTACSLFFMGWAKSHYTKIHWLESSVEIILVGVGAGIVGYLVGFVLSLFTHLL